MIAAGPMSQDTRQKPQPQKKKKKNHNIFLSMTVCQSKNVHAIYFNIQNATQNQKPTWYIHLNNSFQFLKNITHILN